MWLRVRDYQIRLSQLFKGQEIVTKESRVPLAN